MEFILEILEHTLEDTWTMLPLLYGAYLLIEFIERRDSDDSPLFFGLQKYGPALGALVGLIPQCGFSVLAAMLFLQNNITFGTMIAVFIATSDEAIPVLLSSPDLYIPMLWILICKFVLASAVGFLCDLLFFRKKKILLFQDMPEEEEVDEIEEDQSNARSCPCCYPDLPIWKSALYRTLKIFAWIFGVTFVFTALIHGMGEETIGKFLLQGTVWQPVLAALFGFIPNCAATVVLCQLYLLGELSFGAMFAGLVTNAGLGLLVLIQYKAEKKDLLKTVLVLFAAGVLSGMLLKWIM